MENDRDNVINFILTGNCINMDNPTVKLINILGLNKKLSHFVNVGNKVVLNFVACEHCITPELKRRMTVTSGWLEDKSSPQLYERMNTNLFI